MSTARPSSRPRIKAHAPRASRWWHPAPAAPEGHPDLTQAGTATKDTLADFTLRFAPRHYRKWPAGVVAISALGGIAYLADFAIGANIGISHGTVNALWGIAVFAVVIFATGFPLAYYAARYNIDLDLISRGSGFGYYGSVLSNVIFATFTFIFFALEGSIMAQVPNLGLHIPLPIGYATSTIIIFPLVIYRMKVLSKLQLWTTPLWLILMVLPFVYLVVSHPDSVSTRGRCLPVADRADRRADRLPAVHAAEDAVAVANQRCTGSSRSTATWCRDGWR